MFITKDSRARRGPFPCKSIALTRVVAAYANRLRGVWKVSSCLENIPTTGDPGDTGTSPLATKFWNHRLASAPGGRERDKRVSINVATMECRDYGIMKQQAATRMLRGVVAPPLLSRKKADMQCVVLAREIQ